jgi:hypothetical protein
MNPDDCCTDCCNPDDCCKDDACCKGGHGFLLFAAGVAVGALVVVAVYRREELRPVVLDAAGRARVLGTSLASRLPSRS